MYRQDPIYADSIDETLQKTENNMSGHKESREYDHLYKVCLIGDAGTGKSSVIRRFTDDEFYDNTKPSTSMESSCQTIQFKGDGSNPGPKIRLQVWDWPGGESQSRPTNNHFRGAVAYMACFDISNRSSFINLKTRLAWLKENEYINEGTVVHIVGNKCDRSHQREVPRDTAIELASKYDAGYTESSAKENININDVFKRVAATTYSKFRSKQVSDDRHAVVEEKKYSTKLEAQSISCLSIFFKPTSAKATAVSLVSNIGAIVITIACLAAIGSVGWPLIVAGFVAAGALYTVGTLCNGYVMEKNREELDRKGIDYPYYAFIGYT